MGSSFSWFISISGEIHLEAAMDVATMPP